MTTSELYYLSLFRAGYNCSNCAHNTTDAVWKCNIEEKSENSICKNYLNDGFIKAMKLIDEENKDESSN